MTEEKFCGVGLILGTFTIFCQRKVGHKGPHKEHWDDAEENVTVHWKKSTILENKPK